MENLEVIEKEGILVVDSREVANILRMRHSDLLRDIRKYEESLLNAKLRSVDFFIKSSYVDITGRELDSYQLTKKGCELVAHKRTGKDGIIFTALYIEKFHAMEDTLKSNGLKIPTTMKEVLQIALDQQEQIENLTLENKQLGIKVTEDKPKVLFADSVSASKTSISVGDMAKILNQNGVNTGQNRLFQWFRDNGYLIKQEGVSYNMPTQKSMNLGLFDFKETVVTHSSGDIEIKKTPKVTGKGQLYFTKKFLN